jgi:hypothetical protein
MSSTRTPIIIAASLLAIALVCFGGLYYLITRELTSFTTSVAQVQEAKNRSSTFASLRDLYNDTESARAYAEEHFAASGNTVTTIESLQVFGRGRGYIYEIANVAEESREGGVFDMLTLQVTTAGSWKQVVGAVNALREFPMVHMVKGVSFTHTGAGEKQKDAPVGAWVVRVDIAIPIIKTNI